MLYHKIHIAHVPRYSISIDRACAHNSRLRLPHRRSRGNSPALQDLKCSDRTDGGCVRLIHPRFRRGPDVHSRGQGLARNRRYSRSQHLRPSPCGGHHGNRHPDTGKPGYEGEGAADARALIHSPVHMRRRHPNRPMEHRPHFPHRRTAAHSILHNIYALYPLHGP